MTEGPKQRYGDLSRTPVHRAPHEHCCGCDRRRSAAASRSSATPRSIGAAHGYRIDLRPGRPVLRRTRSSADVAISSARGRTATSTGSDGRFEFSGLPAGAYNLYANRQDLLSARYGERIYNRGGRMIPLADGEHREFRLTLPRRSKIAGTVTDATGQPLAKADVRAVRLMPVALYGYPAAGQMAGTKTDASGAYAFESLDPGDYAICASTTDTLPFDRNVGHAVACTPATADSPERITIAPEQTRLGVNITLRTVRFRRVEGVLNVAGAMSRPVLIFLRNVDEMYDDPSLAVRPATMAAFGSPTCRLGVTFSKWVRLRKARA